MGEAEPLLGTPARQLHTTRSTRIARIGMGHLRWGSPRQDRGFRRYHHEAASGPRPLTRPLAESRTCTAVGTPACFAADQQGVAFRGPVRYPTPLTTTIGLPLPAFGTAQQTRPIDDGHGQLLTQKLTQTGKYDRGTTT